MQPGTHTIASGVLTRDVRTKETWEKTRKGGTNGFVTVLICLAMWLRATSSKNEQEICEVAIQDVLWVLDQMISQGNPAKHASEDVEDVTSVKRSVSFLFHLDIY
jgi:hypothetical protein